jgi:hypothetical protein
MTALDHIKRALRMIGILAESETPDAAQGETALISLNSMLGAWETEGIRLTMPELALATTIPVPANHNDAISYGLAIRLAGEFGVTPTPAVADTQARTFAGLQAMYVQVPDVMLDPALIRPVRGWWGRW